MHTDNERQFVFRHYLPGRLDTRAALHRFHAATGTGPNRRLRRWVVAAVLLALVTGGAWTLYAHREVTLGTQRQDVAETYTLADGTRVTLAPYSTLSYRGDCRHVRIRGRAYLEIRHDPRHPFVISNADYEIRDIGTRLQVDETSRGTTVYVSEGSVSFASTRGRHRAIVLSRGMGALLPAGGDSPRRLPDIDDNSMAWATGRFHFDNTPLPEVLHQLSANFHVALSCSDIRKRLSGDFEATQLDSILPIIEQTLDVTITRKP